MAPAKSDRLLARPAGKAWSYRLRNVLGSHLSADEVVTGVERTPDGGLPLLEVDGILIDIDSDFNNPAEDYAWENSTAIYRTTETAGANFMARTAYIDLAAVTINQEADWLAHIAAHEIGHAIGHYAVATNHPPEAIARYVDYDRGIWTGPGLTAENRGQVSFQDRNGQTDFGHLGACATIMSYCGSPLEIPHELDFAFMENIGYTVEGSYPTEPEQYSYGAWAEYSAWEVVASRTMIFAPIT